MFVCDLLGIGEDLDSRYLIWVYLCLSISVHLMRFL